MKVSRRESVLALATVVVILYGVTVMLARPRVDEWRALRTQQAELVKEIRLDERLVEQKDQWLARFDALSKELPRYAADEKVDVEWLSVIDEVARKYGLEIRRIEPSREKRQGDVFELPIDCKDWEGSLDSIVRFLFDLQARGAMLDIKHLLVKPKGKGVLRGRFTLFCAYTRQTADGPATPGRP